MSPGLRRVESDCQNFDENIALCKLSRDWKTLLELKSLGGVPSPSNKPSTVGGHSGVQEVADRCPWDRAGITEVMPVEAPRKRRRQKT